MAYKSKLYRALRGYLIIKHDARCFMCSHKSMSNHVHHVDGNNCNNNLDNLILLCRVCHNTMHKSKI